MGRITLRSEGLLALEPPGNFPRHCRQSEMEPLKVQHFRLRFSSLKINQSCLDLKQIRQLEVLEGLEWLVEIG